MGSTRLPGKVLADLGGRPVLEHVVSRVRKARRLEDVVVATSDRPADDAVASLCERLGVLCHRGDEEDVLRRYLGAAAAAGAVSIVRITADCPLIDPEVIDVVIAAHERSGADYTSNGLSRTWPRGFDVEVFSTDVLREADGLAKEGADREHVTPAIYRNPGRFRLHHVEPPEGLRASDLRVCVDTPEDLEVLRRIVASSDDPMAMRARDVVAFLRSHPEVAALNRHVRQREVRG